MLLDQYIFTSLTTLTWNQEKNALRQFNYNAMQSKINYHHFVSIKEIKIIENMSDCG